MERNTTLSKVPAVTLGFWIIKILATTLGETGGDTVTMTWLGETTANANDPIKPNLSGHRFHPFLGRVRRGWKPTVGSNPTPSPRRYPRRRGEPMDCGGAEVKPPR